MIIFGPFGILEFGSHRDPALLWCHSWVPGDIERAFPGAEVREANPALAERRWRRFSAEVRRVDAESLALRTAQGIFHQSVYQSLPTQTHRRLLEEWQSGASGIAEWEWWQHHAGRPPPGAS